MEEHYSRLGDNSERTLQQIGSQEWKNITVDWEPRVEEHYSRLRAKSGRILQKIGSQEWKNITVD